MAFSWNGQNIQRSHFLTTVSPKCTPNSFFKILQVLQFFLQTQRSIGKHNCCIDTRLICTLKGNEENYLSNKAWPLENAIFLTGAAHSGCKFTRQNIFRSLLGVVFVHETAPPQKVFSVLNSFPDICFLYGEIIVQSILNLHTYPENWAGKSLDDHDMLRDQEITKEAHAPFGRSTTPRLQ